VILELPIPGKRKGFGCTVNEFGYIRVTKGPYRHKLYHRVKAAQAMEASGRKLTAEFEVDHLCGNRKCPCPNFHLLIMPTVMADRLNGGNHRPRTRNYRKKNHAGV
jgi:hypothetical protein